jgi:hypothetical protein
MVLYEIAACPGGRAWAGASASYLAIIRLEGQP